MLHMFASCWLCRIVFFARLSSVFERFIRSETCAFVSVDAWKEQCFILPVFAVFFNVFIVAT